MKTLQQMPAQMAAAVRPALSTATLDSYRRYLSAMAHYTRQSGARLRHAADRTADLSVGLFFAALSVEEQGHYLLAEADLAALQGSLSGEPERVRQFHRWWMENEEVGCWLGALFVLERVGGHLGQDAKLNLGRLGLRPNQARFVLVHLEADEDHGARSAAACEEWPDKASLLEGARIAADFWVGLHVEAFAGTAEFTQNS